MPHTNSAYTTNYSGGGVGIFGGGNNITIVENTWTNIGTVANTNNSQVVAADGFVWLQTGGNAFIARNTITNYLLEAIQLNAGPSAVVGNVNATVANVCGACGVAAGGSGSPGLTGFGLSNYSTTYVGNWISGGWAGEHGGGSVGQTFTINFSGNSLYLFPPFQELGSWPSAVASIQGCQTLNLCGNTLVTGSYAVCYADTCSNALILNNNFSGVTYCGIGYMWVENSLPNAQIYGNILGQGVTFHAKPQPYNGFGWFLKQNQYLNGSALVPPFLDPAASSAHISN